MDDYKKRIEFIKKLMKDRGFKKLQDLASKMNMLPNTLSSSINYLTKSKNYNTTFSKKLCKALDIDVVEFSKQISSLKNEISSLEMIKNRGEYLSEMFNSYQNEISEIISNLKKDDVYTLITTKRPWEYKNEYIRLTILEAVKQGVVFKYMYPIVNEETKTKMKMFEVDTGWKYLELEHEDFIENMVLLAQEDDYFKNIAEYNKNPVGYFKTKLQIFLTEELLLVYPLFKYILIETEVYGGNMEFAFVEAEVGLSNNMKIEHNYWYPLPTDSKNILFKNFQKITQKTIKK